MPHLGYIGGGNSKNIMHRKRQQSILGNAVIWAVLPLYRLNRRFPFDIFSHCHRLRPSALLFQALRQ